MNVIAQPENELDVAIRNKQRVNYIYNFTKYINWENLSRQKEFTIALYGEKDEALFEEFLKTAAVKKIKNLEVKIKSIQSASEIENLDILYIYKNFEVDLEPVLAKMYENEALLVTEGFPFHESMINFIEIEGDFQFELNEEKINQASLEVDHTLSEFSIQSTVDWENLYTRLQEEIATVQSQQEELDKLAQEIELQKKDLEKQQLILKSTLDQLKVKKLLVKERDAKIESQQKDIQRQLEKLKSLIENVNEQTEANNELKKTYQKQLTNIDIQSEELKNQRALLDDNLKEIDNQRSQIDEQNEILDQQLSDLERQEIISWISIAFGILAVFFIVFMVRSNKKRRESERQLQKKNEQLITLNNSLDSFTYRVSHDLKAPIVNMKTMIGMLNEYTDMSTNPIFPELFENLDLSTARLENTVNDMLELTRIERVEEAKEIVTIKSIFDVLIAEYQEELRRINAEVTLDIKQETLYASSTELKSIFQNLFTNSIKYRSKSRVLNIKVSSTLKDGKCQLVYGDNGQGIDLEKHKNKLFNMFQRFTSDSTVSGTGVGMYIIKKLISKNDGNVKLESEKEQGLTYFINFPIER